MIFCCPQKSGFASLRHFAPATCRWTERLTEIDMSGLGGLNKSPEGVVIGLVQLRLPVVVTKADLARQTERIVYMVGKARRNLGTMDIVVFPEYSLYGLSMDTKPRPLGFEDDLRCAQKVKSFAVICPDGES
jgi:hypothetical protein